MDEGDKIASDETHLSKVSECSDQPKNNSKVSSGKSSLPSHRDKKYLSCFYLLEGYMLWCKSYHVLSLSYHVQVEVENSL